jgi:hypothetical protein
MTIELGQMRQGQQVTGLRVVIELVPSLFCSPDEYFNRNAAFLGGPRSRAEFDMLDLEKQLPDLIKVLDLHGDVQIHTQLDYEEVPMTAFDKLMAQIKATQDRNRKDYEFLAGLTGQTVTGIERNLTASDPSDFSAIPRSELLQDLADTENDIVACETALAIGVTEYGDGESVQRRLDVNRQIKRVIEAELQRRDDGDDPDDGGREA